jgi:phosphatidylinositol transfer protein SFH5
MSAEPAPAVAAATEPKPAVKEPKPATSEATEQKPVVEESKPVISEDVSAPAEATKTETSKAVPESKPAVEESKPAAEATSESKTAAVPEKATPVSTPLSKLFAELPSIIKDADHKEIWGVELADESHVPTTIVLEKFLRANIKDIAKAKAQLIEALKWRKTVDPAKLLTDVEFDNSKFGGLGYVTVYPKTEGHAKEIVTWNIYGSVKDNKATFGNVEE